MQLLLVAATLVATVAVVDLAAVCVVSLDDAADVVLAADAALVADVALLIAVDVLLLPLIAVDVTLLLLLTADALMLAVAKLILAVAEPSCSTVAFEAEFKACVPEFAECSLAADASHLADANHPAVAKPLQLLAVTKYQPGLDHLI